MSAPLRQRTRPWLIILRLLVSGGLLAVLVWQADPAAIWARWRQANLALLALAVGLQIVAIAISAFKWGVLVRASGRPQPYRWLLAVYFMGQFANNFLPTSVGGDAMRVVALGRRSGSYSEASASVFMERLTGFLALSLIALGALLISSTDLFGLRLVTAPELTITAAAFALLALTATAVAFASPWLMARLGHLLPAGLRRPLHSVAETLAAYGNNRVLLLKVMGLSLIFHATWISLHLVAGIALQIEAAALIYALMVPLTDMLGLVPIFFNNVGARDLVFTLYLRQVGVPDATALALAFTVFSIRLLVSSIGGLVLLFGGADLRAGAGKRI